MSSRAFALLLVVAGVSAVYLAPAYQQAIVQVLQALGCMDGASACGVRRVGVRRRDSRL